MAAVVIVGSTYLLAGVPVKVLARWRAAPLGTSANGVKLRTPRSVLIELPDGSRSVRPFRGLRKMPALSENPSRVGLEESSRSRRDSYILISGNDD